jgi:hypothetical protein
MSKQKYLRSFTSSLKQIAQNSPAIKVVCVRLQEAIHETCLKQHNGQEQLKKKKLGFPLIRSPIANQLYGHVQTGQVGLMVTRLLDPELPQAGVARTAEAMPKGGTWLVAGRSNYLFWNGSKV